jgi:hypothetical protein
MLQDLPVYISVSFAVITIATLLLLCYAVRRSRAPNAAKRSLKMLAAMVAWLLIQAILTVKNIYNTHTAMLPPKIMLLGIFPAMVLIIIVFITTWGRQFIDSLPLEIITLTNIVRIPVEIVLVLLCLHKGVPQLMTFEGRNFDIFSGITAPFVAWFGIAKGMMGRRWLLLWNCICLLLLANIVTIALLSAPLYIQLLAFDQPNIAILNFPFSWLPTFIVPVILFGHLVSIRQLVREKRRQ